MTNVCTIVKGSGTLNVRPPHACVRRGSGIVVDIERYKIYYFTTKSMTVFWWLLHHACCGCCGWLWLAVAAMPELPAAPQRPYKGFRRPTPGRRTEGLIMDGPTGWGVPRAGHWQQPPEAVPHRASRQYRGKLPPGVGGGSFREWWAFCTDDHFATAAAGGATWGAARRMEEAHWGWVSVPPARLRTAAADNGRHTPPGESLWPPPAAAVANGAGAELVPVAARLQRHPWARPSASSPTGSSVRRQRFAAPRPRGAVQGAVLSPRDPPPAAAREPRVERQSPDGVDARRWSAHGSSSEGGGAWRRGSHGSPNRAGAAAIMQVQRPGWAGAPSISGGHPPPTTSEWRAQAAAAAAAAAAAEEEEEQRQQLSAAVRCVQRWWRARVQRRRYLTERDRRRAEQMEATERAAVLVQAWWRRRVQRRRFLSDRDRNRAEQLRLQLLSGAPPPLSPGSPLGAPPPWTSSDGNGEEAVRGEQHGRSPPTDTKKRPQLTPKNARRPTDTNARPLVWLRRQRLRTAMGCGVRRHGLWPGDTRAACPAGAPGLVLVRVDRAHGAAVEPEEEEEEGESQAANGTEHLRCLARGAGGSKPIMQHGAWSWPQFRISALIG
eukprot:COSAG01_NODE_411_length_17360_cov_11.401852_18_plen_607_part_00